MIYEEKTGLIRKGLFEVQNAVGVGRREEAYHQSLRMWLEDQKVPFVSKHPHPLELNGNPAHMFFPDFVLWNAITVELKAVPRRLRIEEQVQIFDYLKCRGDHLGLLVNMGLDRVHVDRIVYEQSEPELQQDWQYWTEDIGENERHIGTSVQRALLDIYEKHGVGYGTEATSRLVQFSLRQRGLAFTVEPVCDALYRGHQVDKAPLDCLVADNRILLVFTALFDTNDFNISRGISYLQALGLHWGIAANFGKRMLQINGLRAS